MFSNTKTGDTDSDCRFKRYPKLTRILITGGTSGNLLASKSSLKAGVAEHVRNS